MADGHLVKFKDGECEVVHLGQDNPVQGGRRGLMAREQLRREGPGDTPWESAVVLSNIGGARDGVLHLSLALETHPGLGSGLGLPSTTQ